MTRPSPHTLAVIAAFSVLAAPAWGAAGPADPSKNALPSAASPGAEPGKKQMPELPSPYTPNYTRGAVPPANGQPPDLAYGAYQRGQYVTAFREATKRIEANPKDAPAMTLLGELYNQGLGVKQNPVKAAEWYRLAAAQNDAAAMSSLGLMALDGRGMPKDAKAGRRWLEQATSHGSPTAAYNLGLILIGTGATADEAAAAAQFRKAADAEIGPAQHDLGVLYLQGRGVPKDPAMAAQLFRRGADNGDLASEVEYAILLFNGNGVTKDERSAARYFLHAASRGTRSRRTGSRGSMRSAAACPRTRSRLRPGTSPPPVRGCPMRGSTRPCRASPPTSGPAPSGWRTSGSSSAEGLHLGLRPVDAGFQLRQQDHALLLVRVGAGDHRRHRLRLAAIVRQVRDVGGDVDELAGPRDRVILQTLAPEAARNAGEDVDRRLMGFVLVGVGPLTGRDLKKLHVQGFGIDRLGRDRRTVEVSLLAAEWRALVHHQEAWLLRFGPGAHGRSSTLKAGSTGICMPLTSALVWFAMPTIARNSPCCSAVKPFARAAAVCEWMQ